MSSISSRDSYTVAYSEPIDLAGVRIVDKISSQLMKIPSTSYNERDILLVRLPEI